MACMPGAISNRRMAQSPRIAYARHIDQADRSRNGKRRSLPASGGSNPAASGTRERGMLRGVMLKSEAEDNPVQLYPAAMLDLLWTILAEDVALWPYQVENLLTPLFETPAMRDDPRSSQLRLARRIYTAPT